MKNYKKNILISFSIALLTLANLIFNSVSLSEQSVNTEITKIVYNAITTPRFLFELLIALFTLVLLHILLATFATLIITKFAKVPFITLLTWLIICSSILIGNSTLYPLSSFSIGTNIPDLLFPITLAIFLALLLLSIRNLRNTYKITLLSILILFSFFEFESVNNKVHNEPAEHPNIIVIGVDSLRPDFISPALTPFIWSQINKNGKINNVTTPNARTFPSWFSILSGKLPINTGARFNLTEEKALVKTGMLQWVLKSQGYTTIYAQDERRFNNIDQSYGFETIIGPPANAAEFILANLANLPQMALASNVSLINEIFPYIKANRAAYVTYEPSDFNNNIKKQISISSSPIFLATHFTLPHYPFKIRVPLFLPNEQLNPDDPYTYLYKSMLREADLQVSSLVNDLDEAGYLDNAIVIFLSDHGESFEHPSDGPKNAIPESNFITNSQGHGTNVLSNSQFEVLLSIATFGKAKECDQIFTGNDDYNYSLIDIKPSLMKCLQLDNESDGMSIDEVPPNRPVYSESSINPIVTSNKIIDELQTIANGIYFYKINSDGKLIVKPEIYPKALESKQRSIIKGDYKLATFPSMMDDLIIVDLKNNKWFPASHFENKDIIKSMFLALCLQFKKDAINGVFKQCENPHEFLKQINID